MSSNKEVPWYDPRAGLFGSDYLVEYGALPERETKAEVDFLEREIPLSPGARIFDLACGHGRHSLELAKRGHSVTGQDLSSVFIEEAERQACQAHLDVRWICQDMREVSFRSEFDAVLCLFSSFGYLPDDGEDQLVVDAMARALKPGGVLVLDVRNRDRIMANYRPTSRDQFRNGTVLTCSSSFDLITGRNTEVYQRHTADGRHMEMTAVIRLYTVPELVAMLNQAGLLLRDVFGDYESAKFALDSKRCLILATK